MNDVLTKLKIAGIPMTRGTDIEDLLYDWQSEALRALAKTSDAEQILIRAHLAKEHGAKSIENALKTSQGKHEFAAHVEAYKRSLIKLEDL